MLAFVPSKPTDAPIRDDLVTSTDIIKVNWNYTSYNGGSAILSYSLEMDDGNGGDFKAVIGRRPDYMLQSYRITGG